MNNSSSNSITAFVPGGVVTTQNISTVIKPKENNNSMQFVKIQTPDLSKKAEEQIKIANDSKISKDKIKEVEEEWQSNLLNWKSKRRQQFVGVHSDKNEDDEQNNNGTENARKIKTFAEMIEQRAKAGNKLNFHLQRYIGSSDSEDSGKEEEADINHENNNNSNNNNNHISHNDTPLEEPICADDGHDERFLNDSDEGHDHCQNFANLSDEVDAPQPPINSTFKQGVEAPPTPPTIHSNDKIRPMLDAYGDSELIGDKLELNDEFVENMRIADNRQARNHFVDEDEEEEEEDEEEEEQKHLQRIAFVAKLKAFEQMTQPATQEPKFVPTRVAKAPPPSIPVNKGQSLGSPKIREASVSINQKLVSVDNIMAPMQKGLPQPRQNVSPLALSPSISAHRNEPIPELPVKFQQQQQPPRLTHVQQTVPQPSPPTRQHHSKPTQKQQQQQQQPIQISSSPKPPLSPKPSPPQRTAQSELNQRVVPIEQPVVQQQKQQPISAQPRPESQEHRLKQQQQWQQPSVPHRQQTHIQPTQPRAPSSQVPTRSPPSSPPEQQQQQIIPPRHPKSVQSKPLPAKASTKIPSQAPAASPQPPTRLQPPSQQQQQQQQQPSLKEDKAQDRTVLSVSGKKRCSSCKEELGRGAAAFVIESLNLVYHTNCFRCSVCHVNLSNGFRGVDVRVHAGALHCQNCYSKDGLNYSRV